MFNTDNKGAAIIHGNNLEYYLFSIALYYAEKRSRVWFITPQQFTRIPQGIEVPPSDISKFITFLYLDNCTDLLLKLNSIHTWHTPPTVLIINDFLHYTKPDSEELSRTAFLIANLLDGLQTGFNKVKTKVFLLIACEGNVKQYEQHLQALVNIYNFEVFNTYKQNDINAILNVIKSM